MSRTLCVVASTATLRLPAASAAQDKRYSLARGLVWIEDLDFSNGVIEAEIAGALGVGISGDSRGFVGVAFRVQTDLETYDAFTYVPRTVAPTIKSAVTIPLSTSRFRSGPGPGFGRRHVRLLPI